MKSTAYYEKVNLELAKRIHSLSELASANRDMIDSLELAQIACKTSAPVLITGETGVGKSLLAMAIHYTSPKRTRPCVTLNCGRLADQDIKVRFFGDRHGDDATPGLIAQAENGTLIIDAVDLLPGFVQRDLLSILTSGREAGDAGTKPRNLEARLIATSGGELAQKTARGLFVADLIYCLGEITIRIPPLRERPEDLDALIARALDAANGLHGREVKGLAASARKSLGHYDFPGNVRELFLIIDRAVKNASGDILYVEDLGLAAGSAGGGGHLSADKRFLSLAEMEKRHIAKALLRTGWKRRAAARILGVSETLLNRKIGVYGLEKSGGGE